VQLGGYELLGRLATGGSAHIFLAGKKSGHGLDRLVCLKTLTPERAKDPDFVKSFVAEAELASHLHHGNCVTIYDLGKERGTFFLSMEYILGETLAALLETWTPANPLPLPATTAIISAACDGLHYAHELNAPDGHPYNLVHRDVSPQNIMVTYTGETKVVDFGIAKAEIERPETRTGIVKGKVRYMSPEQIFSMPIDRRSDVYSLGLVMFECLTGQLAFANCSPAQIQYKMMHERLPRLRDANPSIPVELDQICSTALSFQANARFGTARAMGDAINDYLNRIGHPSGREPIADLMSRRFPERSRERSEIVARLMLDGCNLAEVRTTLGARPVMAVDVFGEGSTSEPIPDPTDDPFDDDTTFDPDVQPREDPTMDEVKDEAKRPPPPPKAPPPLPADTTSELLAPIQPGGRTSPHGGTAIEAPSQRTGRFEQDAAARGIQRPAIRPLAADPIAGQEHEFLDRTFLLPEESKHAPSKVEITTKVGAPARRTTWIAVTFFLAGLVAGALIGGAATFIALR
jgi:serine/threonine protein kinase